MGKANYSLVCEAFPTIWPYGRGSIGIGLSTEDIEYSEEWKDIKLTQPSPNQGLSLRTALQPPLGHMSDLVIKGPEEQKQSKLHIYQEY